MSLEGAASCWSGGPWGERGLKPALPETGGLRHPGGLATLDVCACDCRRPQLGLLVVSTVLWFRIW